MLRFKDSINDLAEIVMDIGVIILFGGIGIAAGIGLVAWALYWVFGGCK